MDVDLSEVRDFARDLGKVAGATVPAVKPVVKRALQNTKDDAKSRISGHPSWRKLAPTLGYDEFGLEGEVGYADRGQGELAGIYEFGSARRAPHPTLIPAAEAEAPRFVKALDDVIKALEP
jgi:hypothetical protein